MPGPREVKEKEISGNKGAKEPRAPEKEVTDRQAAELANKGLSEVEKLNRGGR